MEEDVSDDGVRFEIILAMRMQCVGCGHKEDVRLNLLDAAPDNWLHCPNCGPLEQIQTGTRRESKESGRRNFRRGGVVIRCRPINC
jgi:hypothetical protein